VINLAEHAIDAFLGGNAAALLDGVHLGLDLLDRSLFHGLFGWSLGANRWLFFHIHGGDLGLCAKGCLRVTCLCISDRESWFLRFVTELFREGLIHFLLLWSILESHS